MGRFSDNTTKDYCREKLSKKKSKMFNRNNKANEICERDVCRIV